MRRYLLASLMALAGAGVVAARQTPATPADPGQQPAVTFRTETNFVEVHAIVTDEKGKERLERVQIVIGIKTDREIEVKSGLDEGDRVLLDPAQAGDNEMKL